MTLGRLIELYKAEQEGKQIMMRVHHCGYMSYYEHTKEVKLAKCELKDLVSDKQEDIIIFYIKDEENKYEYKL